MVEVDGTAVGFHGMVAPGGGATAPIPGVAVELRLSTPPPTMSRLPSVVMAIASTCLSALGAHACSTPAGETAARCARGCPPRLVKRPPMYTDVLVAMIEYTA